MLAKHGYAIFNQGGSNYSMSTVTLAPLTPAQCHSGGYYVSNPGVEVNPP